MSIGGEPTATLCRVSCWVANAAASSVPPRRFVRRGSVIEVLCPPCWGKRVPGTFVLRSSWLRYRSALTSGSGSQWSTCSDRGGTGSGRRAFGRAVRLSAVGGRQFRRSQIASYPRSLERRVRALRGCRRGARPSTFRRADFAARGPGARLRETGRVECHLGQTRSSRRWRKGTGADAPVLHGADASCLSGHARPRPYRAARSADEAAEALRAEVRAGRLDGDAVEAVLGAAVTVRGDGGRGRPGSRPVRSTPKTAGNHIEHVYGKIDATNRATASLFAVQHGLLPEEVVTGAARRKSAEKEHR